MGRVIVVKLYLNTLGSSFTKDDILRLTDFSTNALERVTVKYSEFFEDNRLLEKCKVREHISGW